MALPNSLSLISEKFTNLNRGEEKKYYKLREDSKGSQQCFVFYQIIEETKECHGRYEPFVEYLPVDPWKPVVPEIEEP
jgi:hypothetical protein